MGPSLVLKRVLVSCPSITRQALRRYLSRGGGVPERCVWMVDALKRELPFPEREVVLALGDEGRLKIDTQSAVGKELYYRGSYEPETAALLSSRLRPGMTFFDVGANIGEFTVRAAARVGAAGRVHAFEASPQTYARLVENVTLNAMTNVVTRNVAVCEGSGRRTFFLSKGRDSGSSALVPAHDFSGETVTVDAVSIDDYCEQQDIRQVDCLKLDIEGAELAALGGASRLLGSATPPLIVIEYHEQVARRAGVALATISALLRSFGYELLQINPDGLVPLNSAQADSMQPFNVLAVPGR